PFVYPTNALIAHDLPTEVVLAIVLHTPSAASTRSHIITTWLAWGLVLVLASLPFELYAGVSLAGLAFTNLELLVLAVLALWGLALATERRLPRMPRGMGPPALILLAILLISAIAAPAWRGVALKFSARQAQGALRAFCLADQLLSQGWPLARRLGLALIAGA